MEETKSGTADSGRLRQTLAAAVINLATLTYGTMLGWTSPMTPRLQSEATPVGTEPMSDEEASWLTGALCAGACLTLPFCSTIVEKLGRRRTGCMVSIPFGISWLLILFAPNFTYLFVARFLSGVGGAICFFLIPLYVAEISADNIRGQLGSFMVFSINIGIVVAYVTGSVMSYRVYAIFGLILPVVFLGAFIFMPETPMHLMRRNRMDDAARSLMWLRNGNKAVVDRELLRLQLLNTERATEDGSVGLKDLFRDRGTIKGLVITLGLLGGQQLSGIFAMVSYTATIFKLAGSSLTPNTATIIVGAIQVFGSWLSTVLMERAGRRPLLLISCAGMGLCHSAISGFCYMQDAGYDVTYFRWIPVAALSTYAVVYNVGMGSGPFIVASEVFSPDIRGLASSIGQFVMWILAFFLVKFFPALMTNLGPAGCFSILASCCFCTFVFVFFLVPETKGRTIESILDELNGFTGRFDEKDYVIASLEMGEKNGHLEKQFNINYEGTR